MNYVIKTTKISFLVILLILGFTFNTLASTESLPNDLMTGKFTTDNSQQFNGTLEELTKTALLVLQYSNISVNHQIKEPDQIIILGGVRVSAFSWGSRIGVLIKKVDESTTVVKVLCEARWGYAKDKSKEILKGITDKLSVFKSNSKPQTNENTSPNEDWLRNVQQVLLDTLTHDPHPKLSVICDGKYGDYLSGKITNYLENQKTQLSIIAMNNQPAITAIDYAKKAGSKYLFVCTPYLKDTSPIVELHCKIIDLETDRLLTANHILNMDKKELPTL